MKLNLLIDNKLELGESTKEDVINPFNGELIQSIPQSSEDQVNRAVLSSKKAFSTWSRTTPSERSLLLLKLADKIDEHAEELAKLESLNCGKPYHLVLADELPAISDVFRFNAGAARCMSGITANEYLEGFTSMIRRDPIGVVGSIAPWNYPLMMGAWKLAPD